VEAAVGGAAYVHFATHGQYSGYDVMRSHLVLAGGGRLNLARVVSPEFDLSRTRLVVLSACDSGLSEAARTPDEFLGLPGGFLEGGAAGVVSALWSINDASTARLFETFYRAHLGGDMPVAAALREAQRSLRDATVESLGLAQIWEAAYLASVEDSPDPHAYGMMRWCRANPQARPCASPYHWAAFVFNGG
jgi:CHAT domain-containing protein